MMVLTSCRVHTMSSRNMVAQPRNAATQTPGLRQENQEAAQHSTAQHSTAQHSTARHGTARHGTARYTARHSTKHGTAQSTTQSRKRQHSEKTIRSGLLEPRRNTTAGATVTGVRRSEVSSVGGVSSTTCVYCCVVQRKWRTTYSTHNLPHTTAQYGIAVVTLSSSRTNSCLRGTAVCGLKISGAVGVQMQAKNIHVAY